MTRTCIWRVRVDHACTHAYNAGKRRVTASAVRARGWQVNNSTLALMREDPPLRNKIQRYGSHSVLFAGDHEARKALGYFLEGGTAVEPSPRSLTSLATLSEIYFQNGSYEKIAKGKSRYLCRRERRYGRNFCEKLCERAGNSENFNGTSCSAVVRRGLRPRCVFRDDRSTFFTTTM